MHALTAPTLAPARQMEHRKQTAKRAKPWDFIDHWPKLIEGLHFSSQEFYARIENALAERQVPNIRVVRVDWKEGGPLSPRREYLRVQRERLIFDICGAPFGTGFFVSYWFGEKPLKLGLLEWCLILLAFLATLSLLAPLPLRLALARYLDVYLTTSQLFWTAVICLPGSIVGLAAILGPRFDDALIQIPLVGYIYERWFRSITLYRLDSTCMYQQAVYTAFLDVIDELTTAQGLKPLSELDRRPVFQELLQRKPRRSRP